MKNDISRLINPKLQNSRNSNIAHSHQFPLVLNNNNFTNYSTRLNNLKDNEKRREMEQKRKEEQEKKKLELMEQLKNKKIDTGEIQKMFNIVSNQKKKFNEYEKGIRKIIEDNNFKEIDKRPDAFKYMIYNCLATKAFGKDFYMDWNKLFYVSYILANVFDDLNDGISHIFYEYIQEYIDSVKNNAGLTESRKIAVLMLYFAILAFSKKEIFDKYAKGFILKMIKPVQRDKGSVDILYSFVYTSSYRIMLTDKDFYHELEDAIPKDLSLHITPSYLLIDILQGKKTPRFYERFKDSVDICDDSAKSDEECFNEEIKKAFNWNK